MRFKRYLMSLGIAFVLIASTPSLHGQTVTEIAYDFYGWYLNAAKHGPKEAYSPVIVANTGEQVRLDFSSYARNLEQQHASRGFIQREIASYDTCNENLNKLVNEDLEKFDDIDHFIDIGCGFILTYKWAHGQELPDGIRVNAAERLDQSISVVELEFYSLNDGEKWYWGNIIAMTYQKYGESWKIETILF